VLDDDEDDEDSGRETKRAKSVAMDGN